MIADDSFVTKIHDHNMAMTRHLTAEDGILMWWAAERFRIMNSLVKLWETCPARKQCQSALNLLRFKRFNDKSNWKDFFKWSVSQCSNLSHCKGSAFWSWSLAGSLTSQIQTRMPQLRELPEPLSLIHLSYWLLISLSNCLSTKLSSFPCIRLY